MFSEMCKHGSRRNEVVYFAEEYWLPRGKVLEQMCFNCGNSCGFSMLSKDIHCPLRLKTISWIWILCYGSCSPLQMLEKYDLGYMHVATTTQKTARNGT